MSYEGAFICMAEGNKDRVGFVKQTTADSVFKMYPGKYGSLADYELLCTDGTKKGQLIKYNICKILLLKCLTWKFLQPPCRGSLASLSGKNYEFVEKVIQC